MWAPHRRRLSFDAQYDADIASCRSEDARLLSGWASLFLSFWCSLMHAFHLVRHVASGTLFRSPPTRDCRRRAFVGSETSPFSWLPWRFRVRFGRLLELCRRRQSVVGATVVFITTLKTVAVRILFLALALTVGMSSTVFSVALMCCNDSQVEERTGRFSLSSTSSSLAMLQGATTLLQKQER